MGFVTTSQLRRGMARAATDISFMLEIYDHWSVIEPNSPSNYFSAHLASLTISFNASIIF